MNCVGPTFVKLLAARSSSWSGWNCFWGRKTNVYFFSFLKRLNRFQRSMITNDNFLWLWINLMYTSSRGREVGVVGGGVCSSMYPISFDWFWFEEKHVLLSGLKSGVDSCFLNLIKSETGGKLSICREAFALAVMVGEGDTLLPYNPVYWDSGSIG